MQMSAGERGAEHREQGVRFAGCTGPENSFTKLPMCHGFVSAGDALGRERPATPMLSFLAGHSGCK